MMNREARIQRYVDQALREGGGSTAGAAQWLAVFVANDVAGSATDSGRADLVEAYRRVAGMKDGSLRVDTPAAAALREAAAAARGMHDPPAADCAEWADWLDRRADRLSDWRRYVNTVVARKPRGSS